MCHQHLVVFQAYSILGTQEKLAKNAGNPVITNPTIVELAHNYNVCGRGGQWQGSN